MYILGIAPYHDCSATLLKDGKIIGAIEEERFTRKKHEFGFPENAINYLLNLEKITLKDINHIAISNVSPNECLKRFIKNYFLKAGFFKEKLKPLNLLKFSAQVGWYIFKDKRGAKKFLNMNIPKEKIHFIEHHLSHASSTFRCSGFDESAILTIDGAGDWASATISYGKGNNIKLDEKILAPNSLGMMYESFTYYLGYTKGMGHENKIMGLAAYGKPILDFSDIISFKKHFFKTNPDYVYSQYKIENIEKKFGKRLCNPPNEKTPEHYRDIAASLQDNLEKASIKLVKYISNKYNTKNLCLAGGVAMNCKMNGAIWETGLFDNIFIQPASGDGGNSLGAALELYARLGKKSKIKMEHAYLGQGYSDSEIENILKKYKIKYRKCKDISKLVAKKISKGKIIAWFQGRTEWGARALGNRSIVADPRSKKTIELLNKNIKLRENWRPFAPSILSGAEKEYFEKACDSPFMILAFKVRKEKQKQIPAVTHVDGTSRPQTVKKEINPRYWNLIKEFENITGIPLILNTSFNCREPIINTPKEALRTFFSSGLDGLAIGDCFIEK